MLVTIVLNKRLCYGNSILPTLFDRSHLMIAWQWTVATHSEAAAAERSVEEHNRSSEFFKRITNTRHDININPIVTPATKL